MTKEAAIHAFFNSFGIKAFKSSNVPEDVVFPYLTYDLTTSAFDEGDVSISVNLWYYGEGEKPVNAKANEISKALSHGGAILDCDEGKVWIKRGSPWCQHIRDEADPKINRRFLNFTIEYMTYY